MNLSNAPAQYDQANEAQTRRTLESEDKRNIKTGQILNSLIFRDTVTGAPVTVTVASGVLVVTP